MGVLFVAKDKHMIHALDRGVRVSGGAHFPSEVMHEVAPRSRHTHKKRAGERLVCYFCLFTPAWLMGSE